MYSKELPSIMISISFPIMKNKQFIVLQLFGNMKPK